VKCTGKNITGLACEVEDLHFGDKCCYFCGTIIPKELSAPSRAIPPITEPPFTGCPECGKTKVLGKGYCAACGIYCRPPVRENFFIELSAAQAVRCNLGLKHERNDDFGLVASRQVRGEDIRWLIVCDGLSVSQNPHLASEAACKAASQMIELMVMEGVFDPENVIGKAIIAAQNAVLDVPEEAGAKTRDGKPLPKAMTTITVALVAGQRAYYGWAGDSRIYAIYSRDGMCGAQRLSRDDSFLNELIDQGMPREQALREPTASQMSQCLGPLEGGYTLAPHFGELSLENVAAIVATTDGAHFTFDAVDDQPPTQLAQVYATCGNRALPFVEKLTTMANEAGGPDNITVAAIFCNLP
jgi:serine/threonine protein phosphatase PrpC